MKRFNITFTILTTCLIGSIAIADIWEWTDEDGVKHYSNYDPPARATIMMKTHELSSDTEAHKERLEAERLERIKLAKQELAEKEAMLASRQLETEQRIAEADRRAAEALEQAEDLLEQAQKADYDQSDRYPYVSVPYYLPGFYYNGYHSSRGGNYYHKHHFKGSHFRSRRFARYNGLFFSRTRHNDGHFDLHHETHHFSRNLSNRHNKSSHGNRDFHRTGFGGFPARRGRF